MTPRTMTAEEYYGWLRAAHHRLLADLDVSRLDVWQLNQIVSLSHGARMAVGHLERHARAELKRRGERSWSMPLRPVEVYDPLKHELEGA
jgi:hypothetical protein